MLKVSSWNHNDIFMSLLDVSARKPIMVFCHKPTKGSASRTVWENRLRFNFETFITFSVPSFSQFECTTQNFVYCLYCLTCLHRIQKIAYATNSFFFFLHSNMVPHFAYYLYCVVCLHTKVAHTPLCSTILICKAKTNWNNFSLWCVGVKRTL